MGFFARGTAVFRAIDNKKRKQGGKSAIPFGMVEQFIYTYCTEVVRTDQWDLYIDGRADPADFILNWTFENTKKWSRGELQFNQQDLKRFRRPIPDSYQWR